MVFRVVYGCLSSFRAVRYALAVCYTLEGFFKSWGYKLIIGDRLFPRTVGEPRWGGGRRL